MISLVRTKYSSGVPIWQTDPETFSGGFTLDTTGLVIGTVIPAGTPMSANEATRMAAPLNTATIFENAGSSATQYKVNKGSLIATGQNWSPTVGGVSYAVTAVDATNATYDLITVATTLGALSVGAGIFQSSGNGATAGAYNVAVRGLLYEDTTVAVNADVALVYEGYVYARRIPYVPTSVQALLQNIIFSQSF
jgi:hypothetical protein